MDTNETSDTQQSGDNFNQQSLQESSHQATIEAGTDLADSPYVRNDQPVSLESSMMTSDMQSIKAHCEYSHRNLQRQVQELKNAVELELRKRENDTEANLLRANVTKLEQRLTALQRRTAQQTDRSLAMKKEVGDNDTANKRSVADINLKFEQIIGEITENKRKQTELERKFELNNGNRAQSQYAPESLSQMIDACERQLGMYDVRIADMDQRFQEQCKTHNSQGAELNVLRQQLQELTSLTNAYKALTSSLGNNDRKILALQRTVARLSGVTRSLTDDVGKSKEENKRSVSGLEQKVKEVLKETTELKQKLLELETKNESTSGSREQSMDFGGLTQVSDAFERQLGMYDVRIADMDQRFQVLESTKYTEVMTWKIPDFARRKREAVSDRVLSLYSQPFYTSRYGYKMCARVYLNGDGIGKGTHMSLFFVVMKGEYDALLPWPFRQKVTLMLLDQGMEQRHLSETFRPDPTSSSFKKPTSDMNIAFGCPLFVAHNVIDGSSYVSGDTIFLGIHVDATDLENY